MTENLTGVEISGDVNDFSQLVGAFYALYLKEERGHSRVNTSDRALGLCYDIRHASMGDREVIQCDNGLNDEIRCFHNLAVPATNVYYACNCLYPEMCYVMMSLNESVSLRAKKLAKKRYDFEARDNPSVLWDSVIAAVRGLQSAFSECVRELLTGNSHTRWLKIMNGEHSSIHDMATQFLDALNIEYLSYTTDKRAQSFSKIAKRLAEYNRDREYLEIKRLVSQGAAEHNCPEEEIQICGANYPEEIEW
jgi:hypothetical protein